LNDAFRTTFRGGRILLTASVVELPEMVKAAALDQVSAFTDFNEGNDPHEEHDFIKFESVQSRFHLLDYLLRLKLEFGSPDPSDPSVTARVGTLQICIFEKSHSRAGMRPSGVCD
jgi:hypothetical protein